MSEQRLKVTLAEIEAARATICGHVLRTPMLAAPPLSALTGAQIYVKYENLQVTNSFKERGACVKLASSAAASLRCLRAIMRRQSLTMRGASEFRPPL